MKTEAKSPSSFEELDCEKFDTFKIGQLVRVSVDDIMSPWKKSNSKMIGIITGFFILRGTTDQVKGSPIASNSVGAHVLIGSTAYKFHISHLDPFKSKLKNG